LAAVSSSGARAQLSNEENIKMGESEVRSRFSTEGNVGRHPSGDRGPGVSPLGRRADAGHIGPHTAGKGWTPGHLRGDDGDLVFKTGNAAKRDLGPTPRR
jgi:hypothetical protein